MSSALRPRIVVVGAGHLGRYHLAKIAALPEAQLVGIVEPHPQRRQAAQTQFDVTAAPTLETFAGQADGVIIAAPTHLHCALAEQALDLGCHVLVEKPLAASFAQAQRVVLHAEAKQKILQVGHTERFNPAIVGAWPLLQKPRYFIAERLSPFSGRSCDIDVIFDLMIHDLDIVSSLIPARLVEIRAVGVALLTASVDMASVRLAFADGSVAQLSAGRASLESSRKIRVFTDARYVSVDCHSRDVKAIRRLPASDPKKLWPSIVAEPVHIADADALALQDADFVACIAHNRTPRIDGHSTLRALQMAEAIQEEINQAHAATAVSPLPPKPSHPAALWDQ